MARHSAQSDVFLAIADPTRRRLLELLSGGEKPVSELAEAFEVTLSAISQHLSVLRGAKLVRERRDGRRRLYRIDPGPLKEVAEWVRFYERFWTEKVEALGKYLEKNP